MTHEIWPPERDAALIKLSAAGHGTFAIALQLGSSRGAVKARMARLRRAGRLPPSTRPNSGAARTRIVHDDLAAIARAWGHALNGRRYDDMCDV